MSQVEKFVKIVSFLEKYKIKNAIINDDLTVDVDGDVYLSGRNLNEIPFQFGKVTGYFNCSRNNLTSLKGCPRWVGNNFYCFDNHLSTLEGGPKYVGEGFYCGENQLTSLDGCPREIKDDFYCNNNQLTSLIGSPEYVGGYFYCNNNQLSSLVGAPKKIGYQLNCTNNPDLKSLKGIGVVRGKIYSDFFEGKLEDYKGEL